MSSVTVGVGDVFVSVRSKSGRRWRVRGPARGYAATGRWILDPVGAIRRGGGVRSIAVEEDGLMDERRWRRVDG